jgi:CYTH domain-containing protein
MADFEIERRFLVNSSEFFEYIKNRRCHEVEHISQFYLYDGDNFLVRYRISNDKAFITVKGKNRDGVAEEYEVEALAHPSIQRNKPAIKKTRHSFPINGLMWQVDVIDGSEFVIAEVEFGSVDESKELIDMPAWVEREITGEHQYSNLEIAKSIRT